MSRDADFRVLEKVANNLLVEDSAIWLLDTVYTHGWPARRLNVTCSGEAKETPEHVTGKDGKRYPGSYYHHPDLLDDVIAGLRSEWLSIRQIARLLKVSVGTVHSRCSRCPEATQDVIGEDLKAYKATRRQPPALPDLPRTWSDGEPGKAQVSGL